MKREQKPKVKYVMPGRNEDLMRARLAQSNRNNTVPSGNVYRRPKAGGRNRDW